MFSVGLWYLGAWGQNQPWCTRDQCYIYWNGQGGRLSYVIAFICILHLIEYTQSAVSPQVIRVVKESSV